MEGVVIWPAFIDSRLSRSDGRKLPRRLCVKEPEIREMDDAAKRLNLSPRVEDKAYPRRWHTDRKAIVLQAEISRRLAMEKIARKIRELRSGA